MTKYWKNEQKIYRIQNVNQARRCKWKDVLVCARKLYSEIAAKQCQEEKALYGQQICCCLSVAVSLWSYVLHYFQTAVKRNSRSIKKLECKYFREFTIFIDKSKLFVYRLEFVKVTWFAIKVTFIKYVLIFWHGCTFTGYNEEPIKYLNTQTQLHKLIRKM